MQLGYTIPLQRHLKIRDLPGCPPCDLRFCWDLHLLRPAGRASLFCVHASSRFAFLLYDLTPEEWADVPALYAASLPPILLEEGLNQADVEQYFAQAGVIEVTKTHGRRPVAFLNRAVDDLYALPVGMDDSQREQTQARLFLNDMSCRAAGHEGKGRARDFFRKDLAGCLGK